MKAIYFLFFFLTFYSVRAQINNEDSTAQVVSYWSIGEKQSYSISLQKIKTKGTDTTSNEILTYDVDITVVDSTKDSYTIEWFYHNYNSNSENEIVRKIASLSNDLKVLIVTDELGVIKEVQNWKEISKYINNSMKKLKNEMPDFPQLDKIFKQITDMYTTKEGIEAASIQDVQQFHSFHGGKYKLNEVLEYSINVPNMYNQNEPFDAKVSLYLDEINSDDGNFIIRSSQEVDSEQLTNVTFDYLANISKSMGTPGPKKEDIGKLTNINTTDSRIHESGWIIYSVNTKTVENSGAKSIEERIIEIK